MTGKLLLAVVGMPGSGKSEICSYLQSKGFEVVRFGDLTEEELKKQNLDVNPQNEERVRLELRKNHGMDAYALLSQSKIQKFQKTGANVVIDGLYSWAEYIMLKKTFPDLILILSFTEKNVRYERLGNRKIRPLNLKEAWARDISEIENLQKGGPIAIADYLIDNSVSISDSHKKIDDLLLRISK